MKAKKRRKIVNAEKNDTMYTLFNYLIYSCIFIVLRCDREQNVCIKLLKIHLLSSSYCLIISMLYNIHLIRSMDKGGLSNAHIMINSLITDNYWYLLITQPNYRNLVSLMYVLFTLDTSVVTRNAWGIVLLSHSLYTYETIPLAYTFFRYTANTSRYTERLSLYIL